MHIKQDYNYYCARIVKKKEFDFIFYVKKGIILQARQKMVQFEGKGALREKGAKVLAQTRGQFLKIKELQR